MNDNLNVKSLFAMRINLVLKCALHFSPAIKGAPDIMSVIVTKVSALTIIGLEITLSI